MSLIAKYRSYAVLLGLATLGCQILLLRQFMSVFYGNELVIGFCLAMWLFWVSLGTWSAKYMLPHLSITPKRFSQLLLLGVLLTLGMFILTKYVRLIFAIPYGEFIPFSTVFLFCLVALAPPCLFFGLLFAFLTRLVYAHRLTEPAGFVYSFEAAGTVVAGLSLSLLTLRFSNMSCLLILFAFIAFFLFLLNRSLLSLLLSLSAIALLMSPILSKLETNIRQTYWSSVGENMQLVEWRDSKYGQVSIIEWGGGTFLYQNGIKICALPDSIGSQQRAATIMTQHPNPKNILLVEGSLDLALECAKFATVDAVHMNQAAFKLALSQMDSSAQREWQHGNIRLFHTDGRRLLQTTSEQWDIICVNVGSPVSAAQNRYYTLEFIRQVQERLKPGGLFVISDFPSAENYLGDELVALNRIQYVTLKSVFPDILRLPGESAIYFATEQKSSLTTDVPTLFQRYNEYDVQQRYFYPQMFWQIYDTLRMRQVQDKLLQAPAKFLNRDFRPVSYLYDFLLWFKMVQGENKLFKQLLSVPFVLIIVILILLSSLVILPAFFKNALAVRARFSYVLTAYIGFVGMAFSILLILAFQTLFGYLYSYLALAMAASMAGMALGSAFSNRYMVRWSPRNALLLALFLLILTLAGVLPLFSWMSRSFSMILFTLFILWTGTLVGFAFPLLCRFNAQHQHEPNLGTIYAADLVGGAVGALLICSVLVPVYGFGKTLLLCFLLCGIGLLVLLNPYWANTPDSHAHS